MAGPNQVQQQQATVIPRVAEFAQMLKMRSGFELVSHTDTPNQVRMLGRVPNNMMESWKVIMHRLLTESERSSWSVDISKQYFLRHSRLVYGWRIILQGQDVGSRLPELSEVVSNAPRAKVIVEEQRLYGASANRNAPRGGKGAQGVLTAVVGPMAIAAQRSSGGG